MRSEEEESSVLEKFGRDWGDAVRGWQALGEAGRGCEQLAQAGSGGWERLAGLERDVERQN